MDVTRELIRRILELREILLSPQTGFNLVIAAVVCAILERISGLEPSLVITEPRYLKLVTVSSFCMSIHFVLCVDDASGVVVVILNDNTPKKKKEEKKSIIYSNSLSMSLESVPISSSTFSQVHRIVLFSFILA